MEMIRITHPGLTPEHDTEVPESSLWLHERAGWQRSDKEPIGDYPDPKMESVTHTDEEVTGTASKEASKESTSKSRSTVRTTEKKEDSK